MRKEAGSGESRKERPPIHYVNGAQSGSARGPHSFFQAFFLPSDAQAARGEGSDQDGRTDGSAFLQEATTRASFRLTAEVEACIAKGSLPAHRRGAEILRLLHSNLVSVITGSTGVGKTTIIPLLILLQYPHARVLVAQPRRIAAVAAAQRVSALLGKGSVGATVGYHIGHEAAVQSRETRLLFVTTGMLRRYLGQALRRLSCPETNEKEAGAGQSQVEKRPRNDMGTQGRSRVVPASVPLQAGDACAERSSLGEGGEERAAGEHEGATAAGSCRVETPSLDFDNLMAEMERIAGEEARGKGDTGGTKSIEFFPFDFVIVDEVHERSVDGDLSLLFLKFLLVLRLASRALSKGVPLDDLAREQTRETGGSGPSCSLASPAGDRLESLIPFRVCIMSATVVTETFARYFSPAALGDLLVGYRQWKGMDAGEWKAHLGGDRDGTEEWRAAVDEHGARSSRAPGRSASCCSPSDYSYHRSSQAISLGRQSMAGHLEVSSGLLYPVHEAYLEDVLRLVLRVPRGGDGQGQTHVRRPAAGNPGARASGRGGLCPKKEDGGGLLLTGGLLSFLGSPAETCGPLNVGKSCLSLVTDAPQNAEQCVDAFAPRGPPSPVLASSPFSTGACSSAVSFKASAESHSGRPLVARRDEDTRQGNRISACDPTESRIRELTRNFFAEGAPPPLGGRGAGGGLSFAGEDGEVLDLYSVGAQLIIAVKERLSEARRSTARGHGELQTDAFTYDAGRREAEGDERRPGAVLVFLPGKAEIRRMHEALEPFRISHGLYIVELHRDAHRRSFQEAMRPGNFSCGGYTGGSLQGPQWRRGDNAHCRGGHKVRSRGARRRSFTKVVLCTDVAESSLTVPDVFLVVDFCLRKASYVHPATSTKLLRLQWASQVSMIQRKGRTGRTCEGLVCRLIPRRLWDRLPLADLPEIFRSPLEDVILDILAAFPFCSSDLPFVLSQVLDPPRSRDVFHAIAVLHARGAVTCIENFNKQGSAFDISLTPLGTVCCELPLPSWLVKAVLLGRLLGVLDGVLRAAAVFASGHTSLYLLSELSYVRHGTSVSAVRPKCGISFSSPSSSGHFINSRRTKVAASRGPLSFRRLLYASLPPSLHRPSPSSAVCAPSKKASAAEGERLAVRDEEVWGAKIPCDVSAEIITLIELERAFGLRALQPDIGERTVSEDGGGGECRRRKNGPVLQGSFLTPAVLFLSSTSQRGLRDPRTAEGVFVVPGGTEDEDLYTPSSVFGRGLLTNQQTGSARGALGAQRASGAVVGPSASASSSSFAASSSYLSLRSWVWRVQLALAGGSAPYGFSFAEEDPGTEGMLGEAFTSCYAPARQREAELRKMLAVEELESLLVACDFLSSGSPAAAKPPGNAVELEKTPAGPHSDRPLTCTASENAGSQRGGSPLRKQPGGCNAGPHDAQKAQANGHWSKGRSSGSSVAGVRENDQAEESPLAAAEALVDLVACNEEELTFPAAGSRSSNEAWQASLTRICGALSPAVFACMPLLKSVDLSRLLVVAATFPLSGAPAGAANERREVEAFLVAFLLRKDEEENAEGVRLASCGDVRGNSGSPTYTSNQFSLVGWASSDVGMLRPNISASPQSGDACEWRTTHKAHSCGSQQPSWAEEPLGDEPVGDATRSAMGGTHSGYQRHGPAVEEGRGGGQHGTNSAQEAPSGKADLPCSTSASPYPQSRWANGLQGLGGAPARACESRSGPGVERNHAIPARETMWRGCWEESANQTDSTSFLPDHSVLSRGSPQWGRPCFPTWGTGDSRQQPTFCSHWYPPSQGASLFPNCLDAPLQQREFTSTHCVLSPHANTATEGAFGQLFDRNLSCYQQTTAGCLWGAGVVSSTENVQPALLSGAGNVAPGQFASRGDSCLPSLSHQVPGLLSPVLHSLLSPASSFSSAGRQQRRKRGQRGQSNLFCPTASGWLSGDSARALPGPSSPADFSGGHPRHPSGFYRGPHYQQTQLSSSGQPGPSARIPHSITGELSGLPTASAPPRPAPTGELKGSCTGSAGDGISSCHLDRPSLVSPEGEPVAATLTRSPPYARPRDLSAVCQIERRDLAKERRKQQRSRKGQGSGEGSGRSFPHGSANSDRPESFFAEESPQQWGKGAGAAAVRVGVAACGAGTGEGEPGAYVAWKSRPMPSRAFLLEFTSREKKDELLWMRRHRFHCLGCVGEGNKKQPSRFLEFSRLAGDEVRVAGSPPWSAAAAFASPSFEAAGSRCGDPGSETAVASRATTPSLLEAKQEFSLSDATEPDWDDYAGGGSTSSLGQTASSERNGECVTPEGWMAQGPEAVCQDQPLIGASSILAGAAGFYPRQPRSASAHFASSRRKLSLLRIAEWGGSASRAAEQFRVAASAAASEGFGRRNDEKTDPSSASLGADEWYYGPLPLKREIVAASLFPPVSHFQELLLLLFARSVLVCFKRPAEEAKGQRGKRKGNREKQESPEDTVVSPTGKHEGAARRERVGSPDDGMRSQDIDDKATVRKAKAERMPGSSCAEDLPGGRGAEKRSKPEDLEHTEVQEHEDPACAFIVSVTSGKDFLLLPTYAWYRRDIRCIRAARRCLLAGVAVDVFSYSQSRTPLRETRHRAVLPSLETVRAWQQSVESLLGFLLLPRRRRTTARGREGRLSEAGGRSWLESGESLFDKLAGPEREEPPRARCWEGVSTEGHDCGSKEQEEEPAGKPADRKWRRQTFARSRDVGAVCWRALDWARSAGHEKRKRRKGGEGNDGDTFFYCEIESDVDGGPTLSVACEEEEGTQVLDCHAAPAAGEPAGAASSSPRILMQLLWSSYRQLLRMRDPVEIALLMSCFPVPLPLSAAVPAAPWCSASGPTSPCSLSLPSQSSSCAGDCSCAARAPAFVTASSPPLPALFLGDVGSLGLLPSAEKLVLCGQPLCRYPLSVFPDLVLVFSPASLRVASAVAPEAVPFVPEERTAGGASATGGKKEARGFLRTQAECRSAALQRESTGAAASLADYSFLDPTFFFGICSKHSGDVDVEVLRAISVYLSRKANCNTTDVLFGPSGGFSAKEAVRLALGTCLAEGPAGLLGHSSVGVSKAGTLRGLAEVSRADMDDAAAGGKSPLPAPDVGRWSPTTAAESRPNTRIECHCTSNPCSGGRSVAYEPSPTQGTATCDCTASAGFRQGRKQGPPPQCRSALPGGAQQTTASAERKAATSAQQSRPLDSCLGSPAALIEVWVDPRDVRKSARSVSPSTRSWGQSSNISKLSCLAASSSTGTGTGHTKSDRSEDASPAAPALLRASSPRGRRPSSVQRAQRKMEAWPVRLIPLCGGRSEAQSTQDRRRGTNLDSSGSPSHFGDKLVLLAAVVDALRCASVWKPSAFAFVLSHFEALHEVKKALALGDDQVGWVACGHEQRPHLVGFHFFGRCVYIRSVPKSDEVTSNVAISSPLPFLMGSYFLSPSPYSPRAGGVTAHCLVAFRDESIPSDYSDQEVAVASSSAAGFSSHSSWPRERGRPPPSSRRGEWDEGEALPREQAKIVRHVSRLLCAKEAQIDEEVADAARRALRLRTCQRVLFACLCREKFQQKAETNEQDFALPRDGGELFPSCFSREEGGRISASDLVQEARRLEPALLHVLSLHRLQRRTGLQEYRMYTIHNPCDRSSQDTDPLSTLERRLGEGQPLSSADRAPYSVSATVGGDDTRGGGASRASLRRQDPSSARSPDALPADVVPPEVVRDKTVSLLRRMLSVVTADTCPSLEDTGTSSLYSGANAEQQTNGCPLCTGTEGTRRTSVLGSPVDWLRQKKKAKGRAGSRENDNCRFSSFSDETGKQRTDGEEASAEERLCMTCALTLTNELVWRVIEQDRRGEDEEEEDQRDAPAWTSSSSYWGSLPSGDGGPQLIRWRRPFSKASPDIFSSLGLHCLDGSHALFRRTESGNCGTPWHISTDEAKAEGARQDRLRAVSGDEQERSGRRQCSDVLPCTVPTGTTETGGSHDLHPNSPSRIPQDLYAKWHDGGEVAEATSNCVADCLSRKRRWPDGRAKVMKNCVSRADSQTMKQRAVSTGSLGEEETQPCKLKDRGRRTKQAAGNSGCDRRECKGRWGGRTGAKKCGRQEQQVVDVDMGEKRCWLDELWGTSAEGAET